MTVFEQVPAEIKTNSKIVQAHVDDTRRAREMGRIGSIFGSRENASTYIAGFLAIFFAIMLALIVFVPIGPGIDRKDVLQVFGGFFLASLGYVFGSLSGRRE